MLFWYVFTILNLRPDFVEAMTIKLRKGLLGSPDLNLEKVMRICQNAKWNQTTLSVVERK